MSEYPEHEKLKQVQPMSQACCDFLEWLGLRGVILATYDDSGRLTPDCRSREELLAEHFDINRDTLEQEKRDMLAAHSKAS